MDVEPTDPVTVMSTHPLFALSLINKSSNIDVLPCLAMILLKLVILYCVLIEKIDVFSSCYC